MTTFSDWLVNELRIRDMSPADLARAMKKDQGVVSRLLRNERKPTPDTLIAIARALHLPPETVFAAAGILPAKKDDGLTPRKRQLLHILDEIDDDTLTESIIAMLERQLEQKQKQTPGHGSLKVVRR